jgi:hypothetical protein
MMSGRHMLDTKIWIYLWQNRPPEVPARGVATGIDARSGSRVQSDVSATACFPTTDQKLPEQEKSRTRSKEES